MRKLRGNGERMRKCHSLSISSFSFHFLILCWFPHSLSISSPFPHFLSISSSFPHSLFISSQPGCKAATIRAALRQCKNYNGRSECVQSILSTLLMKFHPQGIVTLVSCHFTHHHRRHHHNHDHNYHPHHLHHFHFVCHILFKCKLHWTTQWL